MKTQIGIQDKNRREVVKILHRILSDEYLLLIKTKNYHWNVVGPDFDELHKFFDAQYEKLSGFSDEVAERARSLGEKTIGTMAEFLKNSTLKETPGNYPPSKKMVENLLRDHESLIRHLRQDLNDCATRLEDMGTSDFLTGLMEEHEKMAWMLRSYLEG